MSTTSLILDFETFATDPHATVIEIGAIAVNRSDFTTFSGLNLKPAFLPQIADGRSFNEATARWHISKNTFPRVDGILPITECVRRLADFIAYHNPVRIWAWGKDFERPLYENLCLTCGIQTEAFDFRKFACARDQYQNAFGIHAKAPERTHHAHQDCLDELRDLHAALKSMNLTHVF